MTKPPFKKINLLSRKAKDEKGMAAIAQGGDYTIRSKGKIQSPVNPKETLARGSKVHVGTKNETLSATFKSPDTEQEKTYNVPQKKFVPGDISRMTGFEHRETSQGHMDKATMSTGKETVHDRPTTPHMGKVQNESAAKTNARIEAQNQGKTSYNYKGKEEYSGRHEVINKPVTVKTKVPGKVTVVKQTITRPHTTVTKPVMAASRSISRKQEFQNTPWTSTKSQTKAFTSHPNSGGKTKIKWNGGKVKIN